MAALLGQGGGSAVALVFALAIAACLPPVAREPVAPVRAPSPLSVLPHPQTIALTGGTLTLPAPLACHLAAAEFRPLLGVVDGEYRRLTGGHVLEAPPAGGAPCRLALDSALGASAYRLVIDSTVRLTGGSYQAVAMGTVTLLQLLTPTSGGGAVVPRGVIVDQPAVPFRALLVDVARQWHEVAVLEQLIVLARWYKMNYLQLHLTDHSRFTFPTLAYPELLTPGEHYTAAELRHLDAFARARGVTLIPELDVPGHATPLIERRPDRFGFDAPLHLTAPVTVSGQAPRHVGTINLGREAAYAALDTLIGEVAELFPSSPFIHVGGDEASLDGLADDPEVRRYLAAHGLADVDELYRHFLVRMREIVQRHGKRMIVWEGFHGEGSVQIPRDVLVMAWETAYQTPQDLLAGGYTLINVSWKPLYVVGRMKWPVEYIYNGWNLSRWEHFSPQFPSFHPIQLEPTPQVIGAMMAAWEQPPRDELPTLRHRLAALSERVWHGGPTPERPFAWFQGALAHTDAALETVLTPVRLEARGLRFPALAAQREDGNAAEESWFDDTLAVSLTGDSGLVLRYTLDGTMPTTTSPRYTQPVKLGATGPHRARAFTPAGEPVGYDVWRHYRLRPLHAKVDGRFRVPLAAAWEHDATAEFTGRVTIRLASPARRGTIRYTRDGEAPTATAAEYRAPIRLAETARIRAQLFTPAGEPIGQEWAQRFRRVDGPGQSGPTTP